MGRLYTRAGDGGMTRLGDGTSVPKDHRRVETSGLVDQALSALGLARSLAPELLQEPLKRVQEDLVTLMARISRARPEGPVPSPEDLEARIEAIRSLCPFPDRFILPGDSPTGGAIHLARTCLRGAERQAAALAREEGADEPVLAALNRTSDLLFALALWADREEQVRALTAKVLEKLREETPPEGYGERGETTMLLETAKVLLKAMEEQACRGGVPMALAVADGNGSLVAFLRQENVLPVSVDLARKKAFTATQLKMSTADLAPLVQPGGMLFGLQHERDLVVFGGGIPLWEGDQLVGAVGVSGGSVEEDVAVAQAAVEAWKKR